MNKYLFNGQEIVIASHNKGKIEEIKDLLKPLGIKIFSAEKFGLEEPIENGLTFEENALIKSKYVSMKTGIPSLSDDSGICFADLNNKPGIHSARWAGRSKNFDHAIKKIENKMIKNKLFNKSSRRAFFCCALSIYFPNNYFRVSEGKKFAL